MATKAKTIEERLKRKLEWCKYSTMCDNEKCRELRMDFDKVCKSMTGFVKEELKVSDKEWRKKTEEAELEARIDELLKLNDLVTSYKVQSTIDNIIQMLRAKLSTLKKKK